MRANYGKLHPAQYQQSFQRFQNSLGPVGPAMNGQVYFGDPYQYKQYLELRHAVNPFPGLPPRLLAPQAPSYEVYNSARPSRLTLPSNRLTLPSSLQPGLGANSCISNLNGYKTASLSGYGLLPGCGPMTVPNCGALPSCGPVVTGSPVLPSGPVMTSCPVTTAAPVTACEGQEEQNRMGQVLSPTLLNSALNLTPPTSNPTSVLTEETEPELLLPEIPDFGDDILSLEPLTRIDPETPPSILDDPLQIPSLDISSEFELFLGSKLNDHSLDDLLDQSLDESLIKTKVENLVDQKPILAIPTPDSTPVKEPTSSTQDASTLPPISSTQDAQLPSSAMKDVSTPLPVPISSMQDTLTRPPMSIIQDTSTRLPIQTIQQDVLTQLSMPNSQNVPTRLSHFDCSNDAASSLMDIKARFEQATYLRGRSSTSGGLKLTEPTPCLDTKEISGRGIPRSGKRTRKANKQSCSNKKQSKGLPDLVTDNHLLEKVMADTFLNNEHKTADQFFDETMFLGGGNSVGGGLGGLGGQGLLPKQSCVRNMGRDYQHLVNCNRKDWGSSDVSVRILPSGQASNQSADKPFSDPGPLTDSALPSSGLTDEVDFEKEFLF